MTCHSSPPGQNGHHFADDVFKCNFLDRKAWIFIHISLKFLPKGSINNKSAICIGSDNSLALTRRQAIISTYDGLSYRPIYASLSFNKLRGRGLIGPWPWFKITVFPCIEVSIIIISLSWASWDIGSLLRVVTMFWNICVSESGQHWFRQWLVAYWTPSHYLNQSWLIVNWTLKDKLSEILIKIQNFSFLEIYLKILSAKWRPFCPGGNVLNRKIPSSFIGD